jgi:hypothetical protein
MLYNRRTSYSLALEKKAGIKNYTVLILANRAAVATKKGATKALLAVVFYYYV